MEPWKDGWTNNTRYAETFYQRATGALPEMESSKAAARLLAERLAAGDHILDVGCGGGHYLRSLKSALRVPFRYTGVDVTPLYVEAARKAWAAEPAAAFQTGDIFALPFPDGHFDVVMCNNLLYHLPSIVKPVAELLRVARRLVLIRTGIGTRSFYVKEVLSSVWDPYSSVPPEKEFDDNGEPVSFGYLNIYSRAYFEGVVRRAHPGARITLIEDKFFDPATIEGDRQSVRLPNATRILDGMQVMGYVVVPYHFALIEK